MRIGTSPRASFVLALTALVALGQLCSGQNDNDAKVGLLLVGGPNQAQLVREPFFDTTFVPALQLWYSEDLIRRSIRHYMPRTYEQLVQDYDTIYLSYSEPRFFAHTTVNWLSDSVVEGGRGMIFHGFSRYFFPWLETTIGNVSPVEELPEFTSGNRVVWLRVLEPEDRLMSSLPWSQIGDHGYFIAAQGVRARQGSLVLADKAPVGAGTATPFLTFWVIGRGRCLSVTPVYATDNKMGNPFTSWEYHGDFVRNYVLYASGREIPQDFFLLHEIGLALERCHDARLTLIAMAEFVSRLGGNTGALEEEMGRADAMLREIDEAYVGFQFEESLSLAEGLLVNLHEDFGLAMRLKNQAMWWIHIIEWMVLTGTGILVGFLTWTLMVGRRLYSDTRSTRLAENPWD